MKAVKLEEMPQPRILALDQATKLVGYCVATGDRYQTSGVIRLKGRTPWVRVKQLWEWASQMLTITLGDDRPPFDMLVLEIPTAVHGNPQTDRILGATLGVMVAAGWEAGADVIMVTPNQIRKTGYSKENKVAAAHMIPSAGGIPGNVRDDEADAIGAWWAAWTIYKETWILTQASDQED